MAGLAILLILPVFSQQITIVENNSPGASIIISPKASKQVRASAKTLQDFVFNSTKALLPISSQTKNGQNNIHIGNTALVASRLIQLKDLDEDGFILRTLDKNNFLIAGGSDWGTEFGVLFFLEQYMGILSLFPSELGMSIPGKSSLIIPYTNRTENPGYLSRQFAPGTTTQENQIGKWERFNRLRGRLQFGHNLWKLFDPREYYQSHPDFYADYVTSMPTDVRWQPNFSAPGIADSAGNKIIRFFDENPKSGSYSLGVNDITRYDQSPASLKRRSGKTNYLGLEDVTNDYFLWATAVVNKVKEKYPDKLFGFLASNNIGSPPSDAITTDQNMVPFLVYERLRWADPDQKEQGHQLTRSWSKRFSRIGWYDYAYGLNYLVPRVWFHEMQDYLKWGKSNNVSYYYAELYPNWGEGPKAWILSKLLWNPDYNVDSLLNVWYVNAVGQKAAPMLKDYYRIWESFWTKDIPVSQWFQTKKQYLPKRNLSYLDLVSSADIQKSDQLLESAFNLAETEIQKQRIQKITDMWRVYKAAILTWQAEASPDDKKKVQKLSTNKTFISLLNNLQSDSIHSGSIRIIKSSLNIK